MPRTSLLAAFLLLKCASLCEAGAHACAALGSASEMVMKFSDYDLTSTKLKFVGYAEPVVTRVTGPEPAIKIKSYSHEPEVTIVDGQMVITAKGTCAAAEDEESGKAVDRAGSSGVSALVLMGTLAFATKGEAPALTACVGAAMMAMGGNAESHECSPVIEVEIHTPMKDAIDAKIMEMHHGGQFMTCPAETLQWTHQPGVFGGYSGCVGEAGLNPCAQDGFEGADGQTDLNKPFVFNSATGACDSSGYNMETTTFWILWGLPMDTKELVMRTQSNPVVTFPLLRGTYPSYAWGSHGDDAADMKVKFKAFLEYYDGFTASELSNFDVEVSEGAEAGMVELYAAMALHIARTTCNRDIYVLVESPSYGYSNSRAAEIANSMSSSFFEDESCPCYETSSCKDKTLSITTKGFVPGGAIPSATGADGEAYSATSSSANSPWFESMVFPENPSGVRKNPKLDASRRICDGVYLFPMYFGGDDWKVPAKPDCSSWSFSITKIYSASVRAGAILYKNDNELWKGAVMDVMSKVHNIADGIYSEWSWMGQMQIYDMIMAKPVSDPTSWIGAYTLLMKEKWDYIIDGFADCPVVEITNPHQGAYVWFKYLGEYRGLQSSMITSFFMSTLGVKATTYYWGFRGANPADYYGEGSGVYDFTRLQLYRDVNVYKEVGRRAKIVCGGGAVDGFMSISEWKASESGDRRLTETGVEGHARRLKKAAPRLSSTAVKHLATMNHEAQVIDDQIEKHCKAEGYTTSCLFEHAGKHGEDIPFPSL